jgi:hypothetical protein
VGHRTARLEVDQRADTTAYGGLELAHRLATALGVAEAIDRRVEVLKLHMPYHESDHLLAQAYNLFVGGSCLQDLQNLQDAEAVKRLLGAVRLPDPTTAGDFLRRFKACDLKDLQAALDEVRVRAWSCLPRAKRRQATIDMDSTIKPVYGECKQGADFTYNRKYGYHPLLVTLAETGECLRLINRSGNVSSAEGIEREIGAVLPLVSEHFERVYLRGDSKFCRRELVTMADAEGACFAFVKEQSPNLSAIVESLPRTAWAPFHSHLQKERVSKTGATRKKRPRRKKRIAKQRGYRNLRTVREWVAETGYRLTHTEVDCRLVIKRKKLEVRDRQGRLFTEYRYQYVLSNIAAAEMDTAEVVRFAYKRCHQENAIEQLKNGLGGLRMPTGELRANGVFMLAAQITWNLRAWLSLLALPEATLRWEWKWFRQAFVYVGARVVEHSGRVVVRLTRSHRWLTEILKAHERLRRLTPAF